MLIRKDESSTIQAAAVIHQAVVRCSEHIYIDLAKVKLLKFHAPFMRIIKKYILARRNLFSPCALTFLPLLITKMRHSWFGMALASIENDPGAARSFGINVSKYQILAFTIGTALAGLTGGLYAHRMGFISSSDFAFVVSIQIVSMCVIGGLGTLRGPIFGAVLLSALPEVLRFADDYRELVYALLLVIMVRFMPGGLLGDDSPVWKFLVMIWRKIKPRKKTRADLIAEKAAEEGGQA